jgi:hypothetical protein
MDPAGSPIKQPEHFLSVVEKFGGKEQISLIGFDNANTGPATI